MRIAIFSKAIGCDRHPSLTLAAPAVAQTVAPAPAPRIDNSPKVNDGYYRGSQPLDGHYDDLAALGVKTVINLIGGDDVLDEEKAMVEKHGMTSVRIR